MKKGDKFIHTDIIGKKYEITYTGTRREVKGCEFEFFTDDKGKVCFFTDTEVKNMTPDPNLWAEIPQEVKDAALLLGNYFKKQGIDNWALYDVSSRNAYLAGHKMGYNSGLTVAISLAEECGASRTLICGLENSKK